MEFSRSQYSYSLSYVDALFLTFSISFINTSVVYAKCFFVAIFSQLEKDQYDKLPKKKKLA